MHSSIVSPNSRPTLIGSQNTKSRPAALACSATSAQQSIAISDQRLAPFRIIEVLVGEDRELRADRGAAQIGSDIGEGFEPVDIVTPHLAVGVTEMVQPSIRACHAAGYADACARKCGRHLAGQCGG